MTLTPWWDDKTIDCPNQRERGTCRFNKNEICLFMQASGECPAVMPPWGAWRAVVGHYIHPVIAEWDVCAIRDQDEPSLYLILSDSEVFDAVGWSP